MNRSWSLSAILVVVLSGVGACGSSEDVPPAGTAPPPGGGGSGGGSGGSGGGSADNTPLTILATDPPPNATGVQLDDAIVVTFSEPIAPASVNAGSFVIQDSAGRAVTGGTRSVSGDTVRFNPTDSTFVKSGRYQATLTTAIKDSAGNSLAAPFTLSFTISTDEWAPTSIVGAPAARAQHTAVWTGSETIVWGGTGSFGSLNTGARYKPGNPDATAWTATNTAAANTPLGRTGHTAVWTGTEMIVWGGELGAALGPTNTGGRYTPSAGPGAWTTISAALANTPSPRSQHTAVWTGGEMIVWGGVTSGPILLNTGGRFNPNGGGSWRATKSGDTAVPSRVPTARTDHTAVWTGTEMIIWGGIDNFGATNTGARYSPVTDTWQRMADAPIALAGHTAVWTGVEMIVWGGNVFSNQGARYNPATDGWTLVTTDNAPLPRRAHTAVWTGVEMIVWGGSAGSNHGHGYRPASDTWRAINATDPATPVARTGHTAVWDGGEMIVWGGRDGLFLLDTGGRYTP